MHGDLYGNFSSDSRIHLPANAGLSVENCSIGVFLGNDTPFEIESDIQFELHFFINFEIPH